RDDESNTDTHNEPEIEAAPIVQHAGCALRMQVLRRRRLRARRRLNVFTHRATPPPDWDRAAAEAADSSVVRGTTTSRVRRRRPRPTRPAAKTGILPRD